MPLVGHEEKEPASSEHLNVADVSLSRYVKDAVRDVVAALGPDRTAGVGVTGTASAACPASAPVAATATAEPRASATLPLFILLTCRPPPVGNASPVATEPCSVLRSESPRSSPRRGGMTRPSGVKRTYLGGVVERQGCSLADVLAHGEV